VTESGIIIGDSVETKWGCESLYTLKVRIFKVSMVLIGITCCLCDLGRLEILVWPLAWTWKMMSDDVKFIKTH
jgi:hypothetical protein